MIMEISCPTFPLFETNHSGLQIDIHMMRKYLQKECMWHKLELIYKSKQKYKCYKFPA